MKSFVAAIVFGALVILMGCNQGTSGGPGASSPPSKKPKDVATATADTAMTKWDEYTIAMQKQWDQFAAKYAELKERAAKAEGQAKKDLDLKLAEAKTKLDAAATKLDELKSAGGDRWEKVKEGVGSAFDDLKKIFE